MNLNTINEKGHFRNLVRYYESSKNLYDILLGGVKHFGYYPKNKKISEKEAQILFHKIVGEKLNLRKGMKVLDAGCGEGHVSTFLGGKYGCFVEGITVVPFEIQRADFLARKFAVIDKVHYSIMDYSNTRFKDNFFDRIYTTETLSHSPDLLKTLREFYRILKRSGRIVLFEYSFADDKKFSEKELEIIESVMKGAAAPSLKGFRAGKEEDLLKKAGFKKIMVEDITGNIRPSILRLKKFIAFPYFIFVRPFGLQEKFPNTTAAVEFSKIGRKGLIKYMIITAEK